MRESPPLREQPEREPRFSEEQYKMLMRCSKKKDMSEWNKWREESDEEILLEDANFQETYLKGVNFKEAYLKRADLSYADLEGADLALAVMQEANLMETYAQGARLLGAHLKGTNCALARMNKAIFRGAHLEGAILEDTYLKDAVLTTAYLNDASLKGADMEGLKAKWAHFKGADFTRTNLRGADLCYSHMEGAKFLKAIPDGADLRTAHLEYAEFLDTSLKNANLEETHLEGAKLEGVDMRGTRFAKASVDGQTLIWGCRIDEKTDFTGVGLDAARIEPKLKPLLQYNIRRLQWERWYGEHHCRKFPVSLFWFVSDYGRSTRRIVYAFFILSIVFAGIYYVLGFFFPPGPVSNLFKVGVVRVPWWLVPLRAIYFSIVTMTTLGFGDMYANAQSVWGYFLLMFQVLLGYVLLAALITRLAILFTAPGPAGRMDERKTSCRYFRQMLRVEGKILCRWLRAKWRHLWR